jgi:hypothetical protein
MMLPGYPKAAQSAELEHMMLRTRLKCPEEIGCCEITFGATCEVPEQAVSCTRETARRGGANDRATP